MRAALCAALLAPALVAPGCGGGEDEGTTRAPAASAPAATAIAPADVTSTAPARSGAPSEEAIRAALLTGDDLGEGWTAEPTQVADEVLCGPDALGRHALAFAAVRLEGPPAARTGVGHGVLAYPAGVAERVMREMAASFADCERTEGAGRVRLAMLSRPALGDEALAYRYEFMAENDPAVAEIVLIRRSSLVALLVVFAVPGSLERAEVERLASEADRRLFTLAGG